LSVIGASYSQIHDVIEAVHSSHQDPTQMRLAVGDQQAKDLNYPPFFIDVGSIISCLASINLLY